MESVGARIFREAGARVATNVLVRDLDLLVPNVHDGRRLEIVAVGLPLFGGAQLVVDTTLVSPLRGDGSPRPNAAVRDGVALQAARHTPSWWGRVRELGWLSGLEKLVGGGLVKR